MKVSEITTDDVMRFGRIDEVAPDIAHLETMYMPAAKSHIQGYTGLSAEEMDMHPDLTIAVCALCVHLYDNRSLAEESMHENRAVMAIIEKYRRNLIPKGVGG